MSYDSLVLFDLAAHYLISYANVQARGRLNVASLLDKQSDAKLTDHVPTLANSNMAQLFSRGEIGRSGSSSLVMLPAAEGWL